MSIAIRRFKAIPVVMVAMVGNIVVTSNSAAVRAAAIPSLPGQLQPGLYHESGCAAQVPVVLPAGYTPDPMGIDPWQSTVASAEGQRALVAVQSIVDRYAAELLGSYFDQGRQAVVLVSSSGSKVDSSLSAELSPLSSVIPIVNRVSCRTKADAQTDRDFATGRSWLPTGLVPADTSMAIDFDLATARVTVFASTKLKAQESTIKARLGGRADIRFTEIPGPASRTSDATPHWGGAKVVGSGSGCTTAFPVVYNSHWYMLTANHCWNGFATTLSSGANGYGAVVTNPNAIVDVDRIGSSVTTFSRTIYTDPCCPNSRDIIGWSSVVVGSSICNNGSVTTARCGVTVTSLGTSTVCSPIKCYLNMNRATRSGVVITQHGDSGGTVFFRSGASSALAAGLISGCSFSLSATTCDDVIFPSISQILSGLPAGTTIPGSGGPGN